DLRRLTNEMRRGSTSWLMVVGFSSTRVTDNYFFSSRRLHTIFDCDWSSDVCSSDLPIFEGSWVLSSLDFQTNRYDMNLCELCHVDRKSVVWGKSVDLGGRRLNIKKSINF